MTSSFLLLPSEDGTTISSATDSGIMVNYAVIIVEKVTPDQVYVYLWKEYLALGFLFRGISCNSYTMMDLITLAESTQY